MQPTGPFALTVGDAFYFTPPVGLLNPVAGIVVNKSPYDLTISAPVAKTIPAWTADLVMSLTVKAQSAPIAAISHISGVPVLTSGSATGSLASVYVDWLSHSEVPPIGTYPLTLGVQNLTVTEGTVALAAGTEVGLTAGTDVGLASGTEVGLVAGTEVQLVAPATAFAGASGTSGTLIASGTARTVTSVGFSNGGTSGAVVTLTDGTHSLDVDVAGGGAPVSIPFDFSLPASASLTFSSTQTVHGWAVYG